jgi:hypothetical protein
MDFPISGILRNCRSGIRAPIFGRMKSQKPSIKNCPFCRIAMVGSRSHPGKAQIDTFECLQCNTVIRLDASPTDGDRRREHG